MADENQQAQDLGEARETWCRVEGQSGEDWERSERSHNHDILKSSVFDQDKTVYHGRDSWIKGSLKPHKPRKHYKLAYKTHNIL